MPAVLVEGESARGSSDRLLKLETDPVQRKEENKKEKRNKKKLNQIGREIGGTRRFKISDGDTRHRRAPMGQTETLLNLPLNYPAKPRKTQ